MIINGAARSAGAWFAKHLMNAEKNERVTLIEITGLDGADDVPAAFRHMEAIADNRGNRVRNYFYQANINPEAHERLPPEQRTQSVDALERNLGLTDQPRIVIEHEKEGRVHWHVIWLRIDIEKGTAISDSLNYKKHEQTSRELEAAFGLKVGKSSLVPGSQHRHDKDKPKSWERFRGMQSGIDPRELAGQLTGLWQAADSGKSFAAAIQGEGFMLARGDKPGVFLVIDQTGQEHSLVRRLKGITTRDMRSRMADVDRDALPDAATARAAQRAKAICRRAGRPQEGRKAVGAGIATPEPQRAPAALPQASPGFSETEHPQPMAAAPVPFRYTGRHTAQAPGSRFPAGAPPKGQEGGQGMVRGALLAPQPQPTRKPVLETQKALPDEIDRAQRIGRGGPMQYRGKPQAHAAGFRFPAWTSARPAKDPNFKPPPPSKEDRPKDPDAALRRMAGTGPKHQAVNTLAPTPVEIPEDPEERDKYFRAVHEIPHPDDLKDEQDRKKARKQQEQQEQAARRKGERQQGSGRAGAAAKPPPKRGRLPPRGRFTRWLDKFRKFVRKFGGKPTGSEIDSRLLDEAQRTQLAQNRDAAAKAAQASTVRAQPDARPKLIAARMKKSGQHSYETLKLTGREIDTSDMTEPERAESSKEQMRQAKEADRQTKHQNKASDREQDRQEKARRGPLRWFRPE